jgi:uncharacterized protein (TIGR02996 family)
MTQQAAFLKAILEAPDDDGPRLVYADWLDEHGDPNRATFIRIQCKLHRKGKGWVDARDPDYGPMLELERAHGETWLGAMPSLSGIRCWGFWRGFPSIQASTWADLRKHAPRIWEAAPVECVDLCRLTLTDARAMARWPLLGRIRRLSLNWLGQGGLPALTALLDSPHLVGLLDLNLKSCGISDAGAKVVAASPHLTGLESLYLDCNDIGNAGVRALARSPHLPRKLVLDIGRNDYGAAARAVLKKRFPRAHC